MKTAISIPDKVFEEAEKTARKLGMSRSELYVNAVREYVERYGQENITKKLNEVYTDQSANAKLDPELSKMQDNAIKKEDWE